MRDKVIYDDTPVKWMLYPAIIFMLIGMLVGLFISINGFLLPDYFSGEYIHFGRVRPVHVSVVTLLWLLSADVGLIFYFVPRLCGVPLWSVPLAKVAIVLWWISLIFGNFSYPLGTNWGWEFAEMPMWVSWIPVKVLFFVSWSLMVFNLIATVANRKYEKLYVSLWYTLGTLIWTTITVYVGWFHLDFLPGGISKVNANFFYLHNLVGLIFTPMGLATAYYFLPKLANVPIYSHKLSMIGFWTIAFSYAWIGAHHLIHGPISQWLQTTAIVFSIWLFIPVWTVVTNIFGTLKGNWHKYLESPAIRFILMGNVFYLLTCIQGPLMALRNINEITSKTDWVIGHSHISLYGTFTFFAFGGIYYVIPVLARRPFWSKSLSEWHFSLNLLGSLFFILPLWLGGFLQGLDWANWANGRTYAEYLQNIGSMPFIETVARMKPWWLLRTLGGTIVVVANILFAVNVFNTVVLPKDEESLQREGM
jgi:cytochrome c oxidase cbb3-type subunit 1